MYLWEGAEIGAKSVAVEMKIHACTWRRWTHKLVVSLGRYWFEFIGNSINSNRMIGGWLQLFSFYFLSIGREGVKFFLLLLQTLIVWQLAHYNAEMQLNRMDPNGMESNALHTQINSPFVGLVWKLSSGCTAAIYSPSRGEVNWAYWMGGATANWEWRAVMQISR